MLDLLKSKVTRLSKIMMTQSSHLESELNADNETLSTLDSSLQSLKQVNEIFRTNWKETQYPSEHRRVPPVAEARSAKSGSGRDLGSDQNSFAKRLTVKRFSREKELLNQPRVGGSFHASHTNLHQGSLQLPSPDPRVDRPEFKRHGSMFQQPHSVNISSNSSPNARGVIPRFQSFSERAEPQITRFGQRLTKHSDYPVVQMSERLVRRLGARSNPRQSLRSTLPRVESVDDYSEEAKKDEVPDSGNKGVYKRTHPSAQVSSSRIIYDDIYKPSRTFKHQKSF